MEQVYILDKDIEKAETLDPGEYEHCTFSQCTLSKTDLSGCIFLECTFISCDLSLAKLKNTAFRDVVFKDCKMLGLQFGDCNPFGLSFDMENCIADHSSFYKVRLKERRFINSKFEEVDLTDADLTGTLFDRCSFTRAIFDNTTLHKADLSTAGNFSINPERNNISKAKFSLYGLQGLLDRYGIIVE